MNFTYPRTVYFRETDAAGVLYFANGLSLCHEAFEASLVGAGVDLKTFFSSRDIAVPITHAEMDFFRPVFCGDRLEIHLTPHQTTDSSFEIAYQLVLQEHPEKPVSKALTRHVCIQPATRTRHPLPPELQRWLGWEESETLPAEPSSGSVPD